MKKIKKLCELKKDILHEIKKYYYDDNDKLVCELEDCSVVLPKYFAKRPKLLEKNPSITFLWLCGNEYHTNKYMIHIVEKYTVYYHNLRLHVVYT